MKFIKCLVATALLATSWSVSFAQKTNKIPDSYRSKLHLGLGFGLDYGGIGIKVEYLPIKYVGLFGGLGYNFRAIGINLGAQFRPLPDAKIQPIFLAMYGYNGVINIHSIDRVMTAYGLQDVNRTYYGPTLGIGGELKLGKQGNRIYVGILLPFRGSEFKHNYDLVKKLPSVKDDNELLPVTFSIGFNWAI